MRRILLVLAAGALVGLIVAGGAARLAMRVLAVADDGSVAGVQTAMGAVVGQITFEGTLAILVVCASLGVAGALAYVGLRRWLPDGALLRGLTFAGLLVGPALNSAVGGNQDDFVFLNAILALVAFTAVPVAYGLVLPAVVDRVAPAPARPSPAGRILIGVLLAASLVVAVVAVGQGLALADGSRMPTG